MEGKFSVKIEEGRLVLISDLDKDGMPSIEININIAEIFGEIVNEFSKK